MNHRSKELINIIAEKTGLNIKEIDISKIEKAVHARIKELKLTSEYQYWNLLSSSSTEAQEEWKNLIPYLTTGESFFFRDKGQISILEKNILPDLIGKKRTQKTLRIWSAGCSTGEEPYTLAMMLDRLIPNLGDWKIYILATDMTETALNKARRGLYSNWSFREIDQNIKNQYFEKKRNGNWQVIERIRDKVTFKLGNLILDNFPSIIADIHSMDLIVCRNVFIYHKRESVFNVVQKFSKTLVDDGYLLVGHSELYGHSFDNLKAVSLKEGVYYQKLQANKENNKPAIIDLQNGSTNKVNIEISRTREINKKTSRSPTAKLNKTKFKKPTSDESKLNKRGGQSFEETFTKAQSYANKCDYEQAQFYFKQAEELYPFSTKLFYYWAHLELSQENLEYAKTYLQKAIYIDPSFIPAYFDLVNIYKMDNDTTRADKMKQTTLKLLKDMRQNDTIELLKNATASELIEYLES